MRKVEITGNRSYKFGLVAFVLLCVACRRLATLSRPLSTAESKPSASASSQSALESSSSSNKNLPETTATENNSNFQLAFDQSYGFFDDVTEADWKLYQSWARQQGDHRYVPNPSRQWGNPALWYYNNYNPMFNCPHQKRISGIGDGPKWMCDPHRLSRQSERRNEEGKPGCLVYSIGSNGNYEYEDGLVNYIGAGVCEIHVFDYSNDYDRPENKEKNIHFHQLGLGKIGQVRNKFASFPEIIKQLGHEGRPIDIFKIDCEGCEWDTYKDWVGYDVRQVLVETHQLPPQQDLGFDYFKSFKRNNLMMFSKEVNGFGEGKFYEFSYLKLHPDFLGAGSGGETQ